MAKKRRFERTDGVSFKFWQCWVDGDQFVSENGRIGAKPRKWVRNCGSKSLAKYRMETMIREKTRRKNPWDPHGTYHEVISLSEENIKRIVSDWLKNQNWKVSMAWRKSSGPDILATNRNKKWIIEAKGQSLKKYIQTANFHSAIGEILLRMDNPIAKFSVALPDSVHYHKLWQKLPKLVKSSTGITALFIDKHGNVTEHIK